MSSNGIQPIIFEIVWKLPPLDNLVSTVRKPRLYETVKVKTSTGDYDGTVMAIGDVDENNECKVTVSVKPKAHGSQLLGVELIDS